MYRKLAKWVALAAVVGFTFYLCRAHTLMAFTVATYMLMHGIISLDRDVALKGDEKNPGLLVISSISFPFVGLVSLIGIPYLFHKAGYYDSWTFDWLYAATALLIGLALAAYLWIPFLLYWLVDLFFDRFAGKHADAPVA